MKAIGLDFPITDEEFKLLDEKFTRLCWHASHQLVKKNTRNNFTDDVEDIQQELQISMLRAGSYYKRQIFIEKCLSVCNKYAKDEFIFKIIVELENLWMNRTRHGANRQKFGPFQEEMLYKIVRQIVPIEEQPDKNESLKIDSKFSTYCKAIVWNGQKSMGKKISKMKEIRNNCVSLSEHDHLI